MAAARRRPPDKNACRMEDDVDGERPEDGAARKVPLVAPSDARQRMSFPWPWGLVAIGVMALAWIGIYLMWNGMVFLFSL